MFVPDNFLVRYVRNGERKVFITLDKTRAYEYAQQFHGTVVKCFAEDNVGFTALVPEATMSYVSPIVEEDNESARSYSLDS